MKHYCFHAPPSWPFISSAALAASVTQLSPTFFGLHSDPPAELFHIFWPWEGPHREGPHTYHGPSILSRPSVLELLLKVILILSSAGNAIERMCPSRPKIHQELRPAGGLTTRLMEKVSENRAKPASDIFHRLVIPPV